MYAHTEAPGHVATSNYESFQARWSQPCAFIRAHSPWPRPLPPHTTPSEPLALCCPPRGFALHASFRLAGPPFLLEVWVHVLTDVWGHLKHHSPLLTQSGPAILHKNLQGRCPHLFTAQAANAGLVSLRVSPPVGSTGGPPPMPTQVNGLAEMCPAV